MTVLPLITKQCGTIRTVHRKILLFVKSTIEMMICVRLVGFIIHLRIHAIWYASLSLLHYCLQVGYNANWTDAQSICQANGANLTSIHSVKENDFVAGWYSMDFNYSKDYSISALGANSSIIDGSVHRDMTWIGGYSRSQNLTYTWIDGTVMDYQNWAINEPNGEGGIENCVELLTVPDSVTYENDSTTYYWKWNNYRCSQLMRSFVCKVKL